MSIVQYTETEQRLTNTLQMTTEALKQVTAERDALLIEKSGPYFGHYQKSLGKIAVLIGRLEHMTASRNEYQRAADSMAAAHKVERDVLLAGIEGWKADQKENLRIQVAQHQALMKQRQVLEQALEVLNATFSRESVLDAILAIQGVLK